jgi:hypothetical protein
MRGDNEFQQPTRRYELKNRPQQLRPGVQC